MESFPLVGALMASVTMPSASEVQITSVLMFRPDDV